MTFTPGSFVPSTLVTVDEDAVCFAVTIYNLAEGKGFLIGDTIVIPDPLVCKAHIEYKDHVSFQSRSHFFFARQNFEKWV